jgi:Zn-dependent M16 (insulinase) family peptidase
MLTIFMAASDYTIYPFASANAVDFNNLRSVYMDAALFPHLRKLDFKQEGWRLEHEDPKGWYLFDYLTA